MQAILIILGIYLLYKFIADFAIPIYRTSKRVQAHFRDMQERANPNSNPVPPNYNTSSNNHAKVSSKDYIDFEEIKD